MLIIAKTSDLTSSQFVIDISTCRDVKILVICGKPFQVLVQTGYQRNMPLQPLRLNHIFDMTNIDFYILGVAGLASLVLFKSGSRAAKVAITTFGLGCGVGESFRYTSTQFQNEKSRKHWFNSHCLQQDSRLFGRLRVSNSITSCSSV